MSRCIMFAMWVGLLGILIGTATDIDRREVPDWVNYGMLAAGVGLGVMATLLQASWIPLAYSLAGLLLGYLVGAAMYYTGQWGGGDAKMMMGLGALLGLPFLTWTIAPFFLVFLLFSVLAGAGYGLAWMLYLGVRDRKKVAAHIHKVTQTPKMIKLRVVIIVVTLLLIVTAVVTRNLIIILLAVLAACSYLILFLAVFAKAIEKISFIKQLPVEKLVPGDWIVGEVKVGKKVLVPNSNTGITPKQIEAVQQSKLKHVTVKEGIPFVPSFLIAYVVAWWWMGSGLSLLFWL